MLIGDINAHHPYWYDYSANKLGNELHNFIVDKDLVVLNNAEPTRKDRIIDSTIVSTSFSDKISNWKVQQIVYLNTDHNLVTFNISEEEPEESIEKLDFRNADWVKFEKECSESIEGWLESRSVTRDVNEEYRSYIDLIHKTVQEFVPKKGYVDTVKVGGVLDLLNYLKILKKQNGCSKKERMNLIKIK